MRDLSLRALNRATLERQGLLRRWSVPSLRAVERLVGMQAQNPRSPYFALWSRLEGFEPQQLAELIAGRRVVRIALMRSTIHLVSAKDCLTLRPLTQPVQDWAVMANYGKHLQGIDRAKLESVGRELVDAEPRTFAELRTLLGKRWPKRDPAALAMAVRSWVPLVQVPPRGLWDRGGRVAHTSAQAFLGKQLAGRPSPGTMLRRYLAAFGPASVADAQIWSGLTGLRAVADRLRPKLRTFRDPQGRELLDLPDAPRPDPETPAPTRFLPDYDNLLLSHADRTRVVTEEHRKDLMSVNGVGPGTVLVDGWVRATWRIERDGAAATLVVEPLERLAKQDGAAVAEEGIRLLDFAADDADRRDVRVMPAR